MSPTPSKPEIVECPYCGAKNDPNRGSKRCRDCKAEIMSAEVVPFDFPATGQPVRTVTVDGRPWFVGKDAATILGYANPRKAVRDHVPARHRGGNEMVPLADLGLDPQTVLISEPGLYRLIMRSNAPLAEHFQDWVTDEVLPTIRQTGVYSVVEQRKPPTTYAEALRELADSEEEKEQLRAENAELKPSAHSWEILASGKGDLPVADAAKILSRDPAITIGRDRLFEHMAENGWIYRQRGDGRWRAYQTQVDNRRLSELPQQYENKKTAELTLGAPQVRVKIKGLRELHHQLGGVAPLRLGEQLAIGGG